MLLSISEGSEWNTDNILSFYGSVPFSSKITRSDLKGLLHVVLCFYTCFQFKLALEQFMYVVCATSYFWHICQGLGLAALQKSITKQ